MVPHLLPISEARAPKGSTTASERPSSTACWLEGSTGASTSSNYASLTGLIHLRALDTYHLTRFPSLEQFFHDCAAGRLRPYSFLEPNFWTPHNDQHPSSYDSTDHGPAAAGSVLLGENLINRVYDAVRTSRHRRGNNWENTLLIITHDEHGGCYDHVPPGPAVPPGGFSRQEDGFTFDRLGVRVPMVMVSAHIAPGTIVNTVHDHTSFLKTMASRWQLPTLTDRDAAATDFREVFTSPARRDVMTWPVLADHDVPQAWFRADFSTAPLNELQRSIVGMVAALPQARALGLDATRCRRWARRSGSCSRSRACPARTLRRHAASGALARGAGSAAAAREAGARPRRACECRG